MEERNISTMMEKIFKQGITSANNLTIEIHEGYEFPYYRLY